MTNPDKLEAAFSRVQTEIGRKERSLPALIEALDALAQLATARADGYRDELGVQGLKYALESMPE